MFNVHCSPVTVHGSPVTLYRPLPVNSLAELLTVIVIIVILAGTILGVSKYALTNAARSRAQTEIAAMEGALETYKNENGEYPPSTPTRDSGSPAPWGPTERDNSVSLFAALAGNPAKQYFKFKPDQLRKDASGNYYILDPFGSPYNYYCNPNPSITRTNQVTFDLWSYGPDGLNDTADDIVNWRR